MTPEEHLTTRLRSQGYKLTSARRAVISALAAAPRPLSINDLHESARQYDDAIGLVTVYRTLEILEALDLVRPVHLLEHCHGYTLASPGHTHHMVCSLCNNVIEIEGCDLTAFLERIAAETGFQVTGHWLEIEGLCPHCRVNAGNGE